MTKYHLGISYGHNATVAVVADGALVFCQSEERLDRIKNTTGFPYETLAYVYRSICRPEEVASCSLFLARNLGYAMLKRSGFRKLRMVHKIDAAGIAAWEADPAGGRAAHEAYARSIAAVVADSDLTAEGHVWFSRATGLSGHRIFHVDHHVCHGYSTLPFIGPDGDQLVFTLDGEGDGLCASVAVWRDGRLTRISETSEHRSLGKVYEIVTGLLGFKMMEHEYKVMGLAPYAKPEYYRDLTQRLEKLLWVDEAGTWRSSSDNLAADLAALCRYQRFDAGARRRRGDVRLQAGAGRADQGRVCDDAR